jgi:hypothetical protein
MPTRLMMRRMVLVTVAAAAVILLAAAPALAGGDDHENDVVVLKGPANVAEGETVDTVVVFDGSATVAGTVQESLVMFNGPVTISGTVEEDVVSFNGTVTVESGARIGGDLRTRSEPNVDEGATVEGEIGRSPGQFFKEPFPFFGRLLSWLAVTISMLILGVVLLALAPRAADAVETAWRTAVGPTIGWGLLLLVGLPLVALLGFVTLVGIPFGFGLAMALFLLYATGYATAAWLLGRRLVRPPTSRFLAFLAGLAILRLVALIPIVAGIVGAIAVIVGLGALVVAMWRARAVAPAAA